MAGAVNRAAKDKSLQTVSQHMARLDVSGLPRNYELFHEALSGADPGLSREVLALPVSPAQALLDEIGLRHQVPAFIGVLAETREQDTELLLELVEKIAQGVSQKRNFARALETVARSMRDDSATALRDVQAELDYLKASVSQTMLAETELSETLKNAADRLIAADRTAARARTASLADRLTGLPNHAALTERLDAFYDPSSKSGKAALFVVRLADLASLTQTYGQTAANRIVRKAAAIFRKAIKKNDFVARTGVDEFAFLFDEVDRNAAQAIADRLAVSIADNLVFAASGGNSAAMGLSIGIALSTDAFSPQQLRMQASGALDVSRAGGRPAAVFHGDAVRRAG